MSVLPGASGNLATKNLVAFAWLVYETGIDLEKTLRGGGFAKRL